MILINFFLFQAYEKRLNEKEMYKLKTIVFFLEKWYTILLFNIAIRLI